MTVDVLSVLIVVSLGVFVGTCVGLLLGYLARKQQKEWGAMSPREKQVNIALVLACSAIAVAGLAWYAFR